MRSFRFPLRWEIRHGHAGNTPVCDKGEKMSLEDRKIVEAGAVQKQVMIDISIDDLRQLKAAGYKLCFAKKVNSTYDVVWQSYNNYLTTNAFDWTPQYQLFGTNTFQANVIVRVATNVVAIGPGEQSVL